MENPIRAKREIMKLTPNILSVQCFCKLYENELTLCVMILNWEQKFEKLVSCTP